MLKLDVNMQAISLTTKKSTCVVAGSEIHWVYCTLSTNEEIAAVVR